MTFGDGRLHVAHGIVFKRLVDFVGILVLFYFVPRCHILFCVRDFVLICCCFAISEKEIYSSEKTNL